MIYSEHVGASDYSRTQDDGENAFLQLAVPAHDAYPLEHYHVSIFLHWHTLTVN